MRYEKLDSFQKFLIKTLIAAVKKSTDKVVKSNRFHLTGIPQVGLEKVDIV